MKMCMYDLGLEDPLSLEKNNIYKSEDKGNKRRMRNAESQDLDIYIRGHE